MHHLISAMRRWTRRRRLAAPTTTCDACRVHAASPPATPAGVEHPAHDAASTVAADDALPTVEFQLTRIDDPEGLSVILSIRGLLAGQALDALERVATTIAPRTTIHLDLSRASILTVPMMRRLEAWTDALDDAGRSVRIAGLSPHHPALRRQRLL